MLVNARGIEARQIKSCAVSFMNDNYWQRGCLPSMPNSIVDITARYAQSRCAMIAILSLSVINVQMQCVLMLESLVQRTSRRDKGEKGGAWLMPDAV